MLMNLWSFTTSNLLVVLLSLIIAFPSSGYTQEAPAATVKDIQRLDEAEAYAKANKPTLNVYYIPTPNKRIDAEESSYFCYSLDGVRRLLEVDAELRASLDRNVVYKKKASKLYLIIDKKDLQLKEKDKQISLHVANNERMLKQYEEENKARHRAEKKPTFSLFGNPIPWVISGVASVVAIGFGIALATKK